MFENAEILQPPGSVARSDEANAPLRLVLEDPNHRRLVRLRAATLVCLVLVAVAGLIVWVGRDPQNPGFWHVSLVSALFWLSVTQGMMALSALLRVGHASWRYPLNRLLDMASLFGLWVAALLPFLVVARGHIYALGSSDYRDNVWRVSGPIVWDALAIGTNYVAGWLLLYLTCLPDFALLRDRARAGTKEQKIYKRLAWFWTGAGRQWRALRRAEGVLVVGIIASFVGSQTVLGWDFQLAAARNWDSSIFAPLFTLGSLLGGTALCVLVMTLIGRVLPGFVSSRQYDKLGALMIALGLVWFYFRFCDYLTAWYGHIPDEWAIQNNRVRAFPYLAALMTFGCFAAPVFGNMFGGIRRSPLGLSLISVCVLVGLAVQRYLDTVPTFAPNYPLSALTPTLASVTVFLGLAAMFVLTYLAAARFVPVISWWGTSKDRTRTKEQKLGNGIVTVMVEDPPVWET